MEYVIAFMHKCREKIIIHYNYSMRAMLRFCLHIFIYLFTQFYLFILIWIFSNAIKKLGEGDEYKNG